LIFFIVDLIVASITDRLYTSCEVGRFNLVT